VLQPTIVTTATLRVYVASATTTKDLTITTHATLMVITITQQMPVRIFI